MKIDDLPQENIDFMPGYSGVKKELKEMKLKEKIFSLLIIIGILTGTYVFYN